MNPKLEDLLEVSRSATSPAAPSASSAGRYANLLSVSSSLRTYGSTLKVLGIIAGVAAVLGGFVAGGAPWIIAGIVVGAVVGISLHATRTFIAAAGEGLLAVADIATNTAPQFRR